MYFFLHTLYTTCCTFLHILYIYMLYFFLHTLYITCCTFFLHTLYITYTVHYMLYFFFIYLHYMLYFFLHILYTTCCTFFYIHCILCCTFFYIHLTLHAVLFFTYTVHYMLYFFLGDLRRHTLHVHDGKLTDNPNADQHEEKKIYSCTECSGAFDTAKELEVHINEHTTEITQKMIVPSVLNKQL